MPHVDDKPKISIIMPAYNAQYTIAESIESVLRQTYLDFELIIINDDSTDDTTRIIQAYQIQDSRVILINNFFDKGAAGARQSGICYSQGEFIAFLDSDDLWHESKLENTINYMIKKNVSMTYGDYAVFRHNRFVNTIYEVPEKLSYKDLLKYCPIGCLTVVIRRNIIENIRFRNVPKEDYDFWLQILKNEHIAYKVPGCMAFYRVGRDTLSSNKIKELKKQFMLLRYIHKMPLIKVFFNLSYYAARGIAKNIRIKMSLTG
ncbi:TPA: glycosyltransferase family 2 protein [Escherichia coli]|nr:glycosyltransferase family 2 protein [Escherichia coli]